MAKKKMTANKPKKTKKGPNKVKYTSHGTPYNPKTGEVEYPKTTKLTVKNEKYRPRSKRMQEGDKKIITTKAGARYQLVKLSNSRSHK